MDNKQLKTYLRVALFHPFLQCDVAAMECYGSQELSQYQIMIIAIILSSYTLMLKVLLGTVLSAIKVSRAGPIQDLEAKLQIREETTELQSQSNLKLDGIGAKSEMDYYEKLPLLPEDEDNQHTIKV